MEKQTQDLLDQLVGQLKGKEDFDVLREALFKRGVEKLLQAELSAHLGYEKRAKTGGVPEEVANIRNGYSEKTLKTSQGDQRIRVPRDRAGTFEPIIVPKHKTMSTELEDCIQLLYAKGMSNADIIDFVEQTYGIKYSTSQVSLITNTLLADIREWQHRPLQDQYAVIWFDAIHYKIRQDGKVISKAAMLILGVDMEGKQDLLSIFIVEQESATAWSGILDDLKTRGVKDILFLCSDNLTGITKAAEAIFPNSIHQICIVHQLRNSLKFVAHKDRKAVVADMKKIYKADNEAMAKQAFEDFKSNWNDKYPIAVKSWETNWEHLTAFLAFPSEIRKLIYTTNIIESFNSCLRKFTKNKRVFPTDDAALKSIFLAAQQIRKKWQKSRFGWTQVYNQLAIYFEGRIL